MNKFNILIIDHNVKTKQQYVTMLNNILEKKNIHVDVTFCKNKLEIDNLNNKSFDIVFIEWFLSNFIKSVNTDTVYIMSNSDNIEAPIFAMKNDCRFLYKSRNLNKVAGAINLYKVTD